MRLLKTTSALISLKCTEDNEAFFSADEIRLPPLPIKGGKLEFVPKTAVLASDHHFRELGAFIKSYLLLSVNARSVSIYTK